ncbi:MAG: T9SS type A sorting domain-containing protein, partial [Bacteroidia bacterium]|nr:T9SS type A sorting domain-containing protein [Bacteroidia bacterium]
DFGNGNQSTAENPVPQVYNQPGDYYVHYEAFNDTTTQNFYTITNISITSIQNSSSVWGYPVDGNPDLYVIVKENGSIVYQSGFTPDQFPLVSWTGLNINMNPAFTYVLEVWDEDASEFGFGADDFVGNHTMSLNGCVGCAANISVVDYTVNHVIVPPTPFVFTDDTIHVYGYPGEPNVYYDSLNHTLHTDSTQYSLQWYLNGSPQLGQNGGTDTVLISGDYYVIAVNASGCTSFSDTITAIYCDSTWKPGVTKTGSQLSTIDTTGNTMQWYLNGSIIPGATADTYTTTANGVYTLQITNSFGCVFTSLPTTMAVGIEEQQILSANIFPNPAGDLVKITLANNSTISAIEIFDLSGRMVKNVNATSSSETISVRDLPDGFYFVEVSCGNKKAMKRLVVAR